jgi:type III restriction enzyme
VSQVVIDNPVINSPFEEPQRHFRFAANGSTAEILPGRWPSIQFHGKDGVRDA